VKAGPVLSAIKTCWCYLVIITFIKVQRIWGKGKFLTFSQGASQLSARLARKICQLGGRGLQSRPIE